MKNILQGIMLLLSLSACGKSLNPTASTQADVDSACAALQAKVLATFVSPPIKIQYANGLEAYEYSSSIFVFNLNSNGSCNMTVFSI